MVPPASLLSKLLLLPLALPSELLPLARALSKLLLLPLAGALPSKLLRRLTLALLPKLLTLAGALPSKLLPLPPKRPAPSAPLAADRELRKET